MALFQHMHKNIGNLEIPQLVGESKIAIQQSIATIQQLQHVLKRSQSMCTDSQALIKETKILLRTLPAQKRFII